MLIEFIVSNFRSIKAEQRFSLAKAKFKELGETNAFTVEAANRFELLRSSAIYGANASGKSNILKAISAMKRIVTQSASGLQRGDAIPVVPFLLSEESALAPTEFEVTFLVDGVRYQYGFSATTSQIYDEWLFAYPHGRPQRWFSRAWDQNAQQHQWEFGNFLTGEKQVWQKSTRANALFLSTAVLLNSEQLQPLYDWFNNTLRIVNLGGVNPEFTALACDKGNKENVLAFLKAADIGIADIVIEKSIFDPQKNLSNDIPESLRQTIAKNFEGKEIIQDIKMIHQNAKGQTVAFDIEDESDGTQKLFSFAGPWLDTLANGRVLFIDELHDNLHPKLVEYLVQLFHSNEYNPHNAQLIFTTHETSILNQEVFRRDQIWFCEKNEDQETQLYPLTDFSPRKERENLELAYLSGRYGALPFVRIAALKQQRKSA